MRCALLLLLAAAPASAEVLRLTPEQAEAARAAGEARRVEQFAREDEAARAARPPREFGIGLGTRALPSRAHAPLGDVGQSDFVFTRESVAAGRYRSN